MGYNFKKIGDTPIVETIPDEGYMLIESDGVIKRCQNIGGGQGSGGDIDLPTAEEFLGLMMNLDIIEPVSNELNMLFIDENNKIFVI